MGMENQSVTAIVILGLSVAFNTVDHDPPIRSTRKVIWNYTLARQWYHNYLKAKKFKVEIGQEK